jgi:hypothetical protein
MTGGPTIQLEIEALRTLAALFVCFVSCNLALHSIPLDPKSEPSSTRFTIVQYYVRTATSHIPLRNEPHKVTKTHWFFYCIHYTLTRFGAVR